ncbi:SDR family oxidoreductase [Alcaligenes sp. A-TC2]|uniref:SDR family oxidoreductase n=1 Tax=Alcaligenes nematophilus TaxID=2994643 RepID=UPI00225B7CED|nr:SDR family oxidoreductase [Alcaligenes nematophilus]MCX5470138.1 SDR family oxidoreductase [Alcaligenes nematophilus]
MTDLSFYQANFSLAGRCALVTGSSAGLGLEIARAYAAHGAHVILHGRKASKLLPLANELAAGGAQVDTWEHDLADLDSLPDSYQALCQRVGTPDILVNNVGVRLRSRLQDADWDDVEHLLNVDLLATLKLSKYAAQAMLEAQTRHGRIVTLTSIAGPLARPGDAIYPVAKQGLAGMVRALAVEFGGQGITSNGIAPGTFATETNATLAQDPVKGPLVVGRNPLGRWAKPDEIRAAAVFLASPAASYVNGHIVVVDGGFSITF